MFNEYFESNPSSEQEIKDMFAFISILINCFVQIFQLN